MNRDDLSKEKRKEMVEAIKTYFAVEREEIIGDMAAELFLGFMLDKIGPMIYNQAIEDAYRFMGEKLEDLYGLGKV